MNIKSTIAILCSLYLTACTTFTEHNRTVQFPQPVAKTITIHQLTGGDQNVRGYIKITGNVCEIYLRKYPQCLLHEVRHCYEGNWHEGRTTDEDC